MQSKSLLIAIAAFAVTTTSASAYGSKVLNRANLTEDQRSAIEEARDLRQNGDKEAARDLLIEAGIDEQVLHKLRSAAKETRSAIQAAIEAGDYEAFLELVDDLPVRDVITSQEDFTLLQEAHVLRMEGDYDAARAVFEALGVEQRHPLHHVLRNHTATALSSLQRDALRVARQANDKETVTAILEEAGIQVR